MIILSNVSVAITHYLFPWMWPIIYWIPSIQLSIFISPWMWPMFKFIIIHLVALVLGRLSPVVRASCSISVERRTTNILHLHGSTSTYVRQSRDRRYFPRTVGNKEPYFRQDAPTPHTHTLFVDRRNVSLVLTWVGPLIISTAVFFPMFSFSFVGTICGGQIKLF